MLDKKVSVALNDRYLEDLEVLSKRWAVSRPQAIRIAIAEAAKSYRAVASKPGGYRAVARKGAMRAEAEIKSVKDLKREIERQKNAHMGEGVLDLIWVLDLLNSFEARLGERLKPKNFFGKEHPTKCTCTLCCMAKQIMRDEGTER